MKPKPILFSTDMVQAILDGRKTQTRRVIKPQPPEGVSVVYGPEYCTRGRSGAEIYGIHGEGWERKCPYHPGQILWVRETWFKNEECLLYKASRFEKANAYHGRNGWVDIKWRPSIHMPREAARLFLLVKNVRVERLQDITHVDAQCEGVEMASDDELQEYGYRAGFKQLWDSLNAKRGYSWESNPWVEVIEFERTEVAK